MKGKIIRKNSKIKQKPRKLIISKILNSRTVNGVDEYFIKWKNTSNAYNSWVPYNDLTNSKAKIEEYENSINTIIEKELEKERESEPKHLKQVKKPIKTKHKTVKSSKLKLRKSVEPLRPSNNEDSINQINIQPNIGSAKPTEVIKVKFDSSANMSLIVRWSDGQNRTVPYNDFRLNYPQELIAFFESKLVFPFENEGTRKFFQNNCYPKK